MCTGSFLVRILIKMAPLVYCLLFIRSTVHYPPPCSLYVDLRADPLNVRSELQFTLTLIELHEFTFSSFNVSPLSINTTPFRNPSRFLCQMEAYDTSLLRSVRQAAVASDLLDVTLLKRWDDHFTPEILAQATTPSGELWNNEAAGLCDALRWSVLRGHLQSISSVGAILVPGGILLHCTATYCDFHGARVNSHFVPLAMAAGPRLFQLLHDHDNPVVTSLIYAWSPAHKALDTFTLHSSMACMLQRDVTSALSCDTKTIQNNS